MTSWLVVGSQVKAKRGIASGILVTVAPWTYIYMRGRVDLHTSIHIFGGLASHQLYVACSTVLQPTELDVAWDRGCISGVKHKVLGVTLLMLDWYPGNPHTPLPSCQYTLPPVLKHQGGLIASCSLLAAYDVALALR